jgi:hypothetical protein
MRSARTLGAAQITRAASLPSQLQAPNPAREVFLEGARHRNAVLDALFYDVKTIDPDEASKIALHWAAEGSILLVPPSGQGSLSVFFSVEDYFAAGSPASSLVVAGVGSSALGTAAFARNIADALNEPVTAVVSGYGLADLVTEALGGYFWFGALNGLRHHFELLDRLTEPQIVLDASANSIRRVGDALLLGSRDTRTVMALLEDDRQQFRLISGHSKGNLVISEALYCLTEKAPDRAAQLGKFATVVTISATVAIPVQFKTVINVIGAWDWFGALNSRADLPAEYVVPNAWHHTNTELPTHLPVKETLEKILAAGVQGKRGLALS